MRKECQGLASRDIREAIAVIIGEPRLGPRALQARVDALLDRAAADAPFLEAVTSSLVRIRDGMTQLIGILEDVRRVGPGPTAEVGAEAGPPFDPRTAPLVPGQLDLSSGP